MFFVVLEQPQLAVRGTRVLAREQLLLRGRRKVGEANHGAIDEQLDQVRSGATRERTERIDADAKTDKRLEDVAVGGLRLETVGLSWLLVGIVFGTLPQQSAAAVCWVLALLG